MDLDGRPVADGDVVPGDVLSGRELDHPFEAEHGDNGDAVDEGREVSSSCFQNRGIAWRKVGVDGVEERGVRGEGKVVSAVKGRGGGTYNNPTENMHRT